MKNFQVIPPHLQHPIAVEIITSLTCHLKNLRAGDRATFLLSGKDNALVASMALFLLRAQHRVVLLPPDVNYPFSQPASISVYQSSALTLSGIVAPEGRLIEPHSYDDWRLAMFTSGSTGVPKLFAFSLDRIYLTLKWYRHIYGITDQSILATCLPATYNFAFIAGICLAAYTGARLIFEQHPHTLLRRLAAHQAEADRIVILSNPVLLQALSSMDCANRCQQLLVDSGGAALSQTGLSWFRARAYDLREGYGLTAMLFG